MCELLALWTIINVWYRIRADRSFRKSVLSDILINSVARSGMRLKQLELKLSNKAAAGALAAMMQLLD